MKFRQNIVVTNNGTHYSTNIEVGSHQLKSDEPVDQGGSDAGPTAHQLLLSSLGACTAITVRMYADRKKWDVKNITVRLNMESNSENGATKTTIYRKLEFEGTLDQEQRDRLNVIADKCPIHKILSTPVEFKELN